jgi:hypothetical protein
MKTLFYITMIFTLGSANMLVGQYNYDLYKFPEVKVKGLNISFNSLGSYNKYELTKDYKSRNFSYDLESNYFQFLNTGKRQKTDFVSVQNRFSYAKYDLLPIENKVKSFYLNLNKNQINRNYFQNEASFLGLKGKFFEVNHKLTVSYSSVINSSYTQAAADLSLGLGFGRLEPVSEVFDAQFLMNDLLEAGIIKSKFSESELYELAALMAKVKNQRIFDFRRATIYQLTELTNWLNSKGIDQNIKTFTILNDNWTGNFTAQRLNGKRLSFSISPWAQKNWDKRNNVNWESELNRGALASVTYVNAKNKSLFFGTETSLRLSHGFNNAHQADNVTTLSGSYGLIFNPNSRTTISASPTISLATQTFSQHAAQLSLPLNFNYFINNRSRISGFLDLKWLTNDRVIFERPSGVNEFNPNFRSEVYTPLNSIQPYEGSRFTFNAGLKFTYTLF